MILEKDNSYGKLRCAVLWQLFAKEPFNSLCMGSALISSGLDLVLGGEDGIIRVYDTECNKDTPEPKMCVETKGGPIQCVATHNVTRFGQVDILSADAFGSLTVICGQQILCRQNLMSQAITSLMVHEDARGHVEIVSCSDRGLITASNTSTRLWTVNLNDITKSESELSLVSVKCVVGLKLQENTSRCQQYLLAADNTCHLYLLLHGYVVRTFVTPVPVTSMAQGTFIQSLLSNGTPSAAVSSSIVQVALGTAQGSVLIFYNLSAITEGLGNAEGTVTNLLSLSLPYFNHDLLLCAGHFSALDILHEGKLIHRHPTSDWIHSMVAADVDRDEVNEVIIGCLDKSVSALKITCNLS